MGPAVPHSSAGAVAPPRRKKTAAKKGKGAKPLVAGLLYISRVPPFMQPLKLRQLMGAHGEVLRIYMAPEGEARGPAAGRCVVGRGVRTSLHPSFLPVQ